MAKAMGGYFELELRRGNHPYPQAAAFNSARSALQAMLLGNKVRRVFMPHYLCEVMPEAARAVDVEVQRYGLDEYMQLPELLALDPDDRLLYVDYFGLKTDYIRATLAARYGSRLIVDNSQALFSAPLPDVPTLYSPRKFVGVPDGGWLVNGQLSNIPEQSGAEARLKAVLGRLAEGPEKHYSAFMEIEDALGREGLKSMSTTTQRLLDSIDYSEVARCRTENLAHLRSRLDLYNHFRAWPSDASPALCYPLLTESVQAAGALRKILLQQRIYVACYWSDVATASETPALEKAWAERLLPLPIDQRYGIDDMDRLASIIEHASGAL